MANAQFFRGASRISCFRHISGRIAPAAGELVLRCLRRPALPAGRMEETCMICLDDLPMRVGLGQFNELSDERLKFIKQCGCEDFLLNTPRLPGEERWDFRDLLLLRTRAE